MDTAIRFLTAVAYAAVFMVSTSANAVVVLVGPGSPLSLGDGSTVTYGSAAANRVGYSGPATGAANDDFPSQNPDDVRGVIETVFGTSPLMNVGDCDGGGCTAGSSQTGNNAKMGSYTSAVAFNYLALHYDNKELVFEFLNPIMTLMVSGLPNAISNWRSYKIIPPGTAVPIPAAVWLFGSSLGLLGLVRRKQHNNNVAGFAA